MGRQVISVGNEYVSLRLDRLGIEAGSDREALHDSGCGLWRGEEHSEKLRGGHGREGVRGWLFPGGGCGLFWGKNADDQSGVGLKKTGGAGRIYIFLRARCCSRLR